MHANTHGGNGLLEVDVVCLDEMKEEMKICLRALLCLPTATRASEAAASFALPSWR